ncbi:hypothetical protein BDFB_012751, partial [Asbolus verrucosus]
MHLIYDEVGCNSRAAVRLHHERFSNRHAPHRGVFPILIVTFENLEIKMDRQTWSLSVARPEYGLKSFRFLFAELLNRILLASNQIRNN